MSGAADDIEARVRADIEAHGVHLGVVPAEAGTPAWAFTIGLFERFDHPELVAFAPDAEFARGLVAGLAARVRTGARFEDGGAYAGVLGDHEVSFREVADKWIGVFLGNVAWHYGDARFEVLQCFWPDRAGRLPWQEGFDPEWRDDQPLLHRRETHLALSERLVEVLRREGAL